MLNEEYILKCITPKLNKKRELSEFEFFELFSELTRKEHYEIIRILIANDIQYVDEKETETKLPDSLNLLSTPQGKDYKKLLNLKNEQLCVMAQNGDDSAMAAVIYNNKRFVYKIAYKQLKQLSRTCMTIEDLYQVGNIGLIKAVEKFDASLDFSFLTYCWHWVRQAITRAIEDEGFLIRIPVHMFEKIKRINNYRISNPQANQEQLTNIIIENEGKNNRYITAEEIDQCFIYSEYYLNTTSLNSLIGESQETELMDIIPEEGKASAEDLAINSVMKGEIDKVLGELTSREEEILRLRFGLDTGKSMTLEEVGHNYNVTRERIRQIEAKAIRKLRHPKRSKYIRSFYKED